MKGSLLLLSFLMTVSAAQAGDIATCLSKISKNCQTVNASVFRNITTAAECKIVNGGYRETDGSRFDRKVIFFDHNSIVSVETPEANSSARYPKSCSITRANITGSMTDTKASEGRLYISSTQGRLFAVTRNNSVYEIYDDLGIPFNWVKSLGIDGKAITLNGSTYFGKKFSQRVSLPRMTDRVNDPYRARCIGGCSY